MADRTGTGAGGITHGGQEVPLYDAIPHAEHDPTLARMIDKGLPLTRDTYLGLSWGADLPGPDRWNAEHEAEVPECFRMPLPSRPPGRRA